MNDLPGFRFFPTEEELVSFYLRHKLDGGNGPDLDSLINRVVPLLDIYEFNPWELPQFAGDMCHGDPEQWFFFIPRRESEARGGRPKRLTTSGYWKATGSPGYVYSTGSRIIAVKRTMVFYTGRAPAGRKTEWKMNEYKAIQGETSSSTGATPTDQEHVRQEYSLCRVYKQSKFVRAFDRRPPAIDSTGARHQQDQEHVQGSVDIALVVPGSSGLHNSPENESTFDAPGGGSNNDNGIFPNGEENPANLVWDDQDQLMDWFHGI